MITRFIPSRIKVGSALSRWWIIAAGLLLAIFSGATINTTKELVLPAAILGVGIALSLKWPFAVLVSIVFLIPLEAFTTTLGGATVNRFVTIALAVGWGFQHLKTKQPLRLKQPVWVMLAWVMWGVLSRLWSTGYLWTRLVPGLLLAWVLFAAVSEMVTTRSQLTWMLGALLAGMLLFVIVWFTTGDLFRDTYFIPMGGRLGVSEYGNLAGAVMACLLAFGLYARPPLRQFAIVFIAPVGYLLFAIGLRRSFLTVGAVLIALFLFSKRDRFKSLVLIIAVLIAVYWSWKYVVPQLPRGIQNRLTVGSVIETRGTNRLYIWEVAVDVWASHSIFGVGLGDFGAHSMLYPETSYNARDVHNMFLQVLVELGVIGFMLWIWGLVAMTLSIVRTYRASHTRSDRLLSAVPLALMIFFVAGMLVDPYGNWRLMWLTLGLALAADSVLRRQDQDQSDSCSAQSKTGNLSSRPQRELRSAHRCKHG